MKKRENELSENLNQLLSSFKFLTKGSNVKNQPSEKLVQIQQLENQLKCFSQGL